MIKGRLVSGLYLLQGSTINATSIASSSNLDITRLCHMSEAGMPVLSKHGLPSDQKFVMPDFCKHLVYEKQTRIRFGTTIHRTKGNIDCNLQDLVPVPSRGNICM